MSAHVCVSSRRNELNIQSQATRTCSISIDSFCSVVLPGVKAILEATAGDSKDSLQPLAVEWLRITLGSLLLLSEELNSRMLYSASFDSEDISGDDAAFTH